MSPRTGFTASDAEPMLRSEPSSSVTTPAGGGDISPAVKDGATSLAVATPGQALTVVEPPMPDESPAAVGSDEKKTLTWDDLYRNFLAPQLHDTALVQCPDSQRSGAAGEV